MKKKLTIISIFIFIILLFINYNVVLESTITATQIWLYKVFPYLFIMIIIQDILIKLNVSSYFSNISFYIFLMSLLSGTPTSVYIIGNLIKNKIIDKCYGNLCLLFSFFANPLFLYTILNNIFNSKAQAITLIIIHYLSNFIIYLYVKNSLHTNNKANFPANINLAASIKNSLNTNLMVLGTITFYFVISNILIKTLNMPHIMTIIFRGFLEMTQGLASLINLSFSFKDYIAILFLSFGGLSIHTQAKCIASEYGLDYKFFLKGRLWQIIIAIFLTTIAKTIKIIFIKIF